MYERTSTEPRLPMPPPPLEFIPVEPSTDRRLQKDAPERILVHTAHDGNIVPKRYLVDADGNPRVDEVELERLFNLVRDWGADLVAKELAAALGLSGFARCRIARVLLDFNRFPGTTPQGDVDHLERFSIGEPFGSTLAHAEKMGLLGVYDQMSDIIESLVVGSMITIGVHTYDPHNTSATQRPDVSLVATPHTYLREARMPRGLFDPIYPDLLAESTCSRTLRDRLSLNLERSGYRVTHNQPYALPEGSIEVRSQVWFFFNYLKSRFEKDFPQYRGREDYELVWTMLLNTNLRSQRGEALFGYLHRYRRPLPEERESFERARDAYTSVKRYLQDTDVVSDFRRSLFRPSSLAIEVRKDLLISLDDDGRPLPITDEQRQNAKDVAEVMAGAIQMFLETDRHYGRSAVPETSAWNRESPSSSGL